jgi:hypothetical protein
MIRHRAFLRWWLFILLVFLFNIFCLANGIFYSIWDNDITKLSFVILFLFCIQSIICGQQTWAIGFHQNNLLKIDKIKENSEVGWFMSDMFLSIGMIGTVIGFISMLGGFSSLDVNNAETVQGLIKELGSGMSTALYTTLVGLVCSVFLKIQYFNLAQGIESVENKKDI